jgi:hypothetical protein
MPSKSERNWQNHNFGPRMKGLSGLSDIVYNEDKKEWDIISLQQIGGNWNVLLGFNNAAKYYPVGRQQWFLLENGDSYNSTGNYNSTVLKLSKVGVSPPNVYLFSGCLNLTLLHKYLHSIEITFIS